MKIEFEIEGELYTINPLTVYDWYHIQDEIMLNPYPGIGIISYLSGCPEDLLKSMGLEDWEDLWRVTQDFIKLESTSNLLPDKTYKYERIKYGLLNPDDMTIGQFADLDILINSPGQEKKIHEIMASVYRPIISDKDGAIVIEDYDPAKSKVRSNVFLNAPLKDAVKAVNFFLLLGQRSLNNTLDYLNSIDLKKETPEVREIIQMTHRRLLEVGTLLSSFFQEETLPKWTKSPFFRSEQHSTGLHSSKMKSKSKNWKSKKLLAK